MILCISTPYSSFFFLSFLLHRSETNARLLCFTTVQVIRKTETLDKEKDVKAL